MVRTSKEGDAHGVITSVSESIRKEYRKACDWCVGINHGCHRNDGRPGQRGNMFDQGTDPPALRSARPDDGIRNIPKMKASKKPPHNFCEIIAA